ncbi:MAG: class I SAM-dependent methyltransferase [Candidatus Thorarchaeota archaeon]|nr:MAG: class I SAM-dependent methyltransferase [Candidatus Thorarchaeota archaeon]
MEFYNVYEDAKRADAYSRLEFPGTYYLAFRDLPKIISTHATGEKALDFGCGSGRSSRFLQQLGFSTIGIDISAEMVQRARSFDPDGDYRVIQESDFSEQENYSFNLILSAFPFDNIPSMEKKVMNLRGLKNLLRDDDGILINLVSSPEIYWYEWTSFSTKDFPENKNAKSGDIVQIIQMDIEDKRPVEDIIWTHESYLETYQKAGLEIINTYRPLAKESEPYDWINEARIAPWTIYVLKKILT